MKTSFLPLTLLVALSNGIEEVTRKHGIFREAVHGLNAKNAVYNFADPNHGAIDAIDLGSFVTQHVTITKNIGVLEQQRYPVIGTKNTGVPYPVHVANPYPVSVNKAIPYTVQYVPIKDTLEVPVYESAQISEPTLKSVPYLIKSNHAVSIGSGSLGYVHLGNGVYAIGSGSLGYNRVDSGYTSKL